MNTFDQLGLQENILKAIKELGFENPMPVQEAVIPRIIENNTDIVALAQTGTGKTAAFGLPLLQLIDPDNKKTQALILSPTRELCMQIASDLNSYSKYMPNIKVTAVYGGASIEAQAKQLRAGTQIIAATPGRMLDMIMRSTLICRKCVSWFSMKLTKCSIWVLRKMFNQLLKVLPKTATHSFSRLPCRRMLKKLPGGI